MFGIPICSLSANPRLCHSVTSPSAKGGEGIRESCEGLAHRGYLAKSGKNVGAAQVDFAAASLAMTLSGRWLEVPRH